MQLFQLLVRSLELVVVDLELHHRLGRSGLERAIPGPERGRQLNSRLTRNVRVAYRAGLELRLALFEPVQLAL